MGGGCLLPTASSSGAPCPAWLLLLTGLLLTMCPLVITDQGKECSVKNFTSLEKTVVDLTLTMLTESPSSRTKCQLLRNTTASTERLVEKCWDSAESRNDSSSLGAFFKFVKSLEIRAFKAMTTLLCEGQIPAETSSGCDLKALEVELRNFFDLTAEYGSGEYRCSFLWTSRDRIVEKVLGCSEKTQSVLSALTGQVNSMSSMACMAPTCNVDYARTCLSYARHSLAINWGNGTAAAASRQRVCRDLKLSLACATNHTIDCRGPTYNMLFEQVDYVRVRYHQYCNVTEAKPPCTRQISAENAQWILHTAAQIDLFPTPVVCSLAHRKEWFGSDPESSPLIQASPVLRDLCWNTTKAPSSCQCDTTAESDVKTHHDSLVSAAFKKDTSICNATEVSIIALFRRMTACDSVYKSTQVTLLDNAFSRLCGTNLKTSHLICPTACNASACLPVTCGDISECLAQNTAGCDTQEVLENALYHQGAREKQCQLKNDTGIQLAHRPGLNAVLRCMKGFTTTWMDTESMPMGLYCNGLKGLSQCLEPLEKQEDASKDPLLFKPAKYSRQLVNMIRDRLCDFLPEKDCGSGTKADVIFVLDSSGSVGLPNMKLLLSFVKNVLSEWDIGTEKIRVGVIKFSTRPNVEFFLNRYESKTELIEAISNIKYTSGKTFTDLALSMLTDTMFNETNGDRKDVPNFGIVITDGKSYDDNRTIAQALRAKKKGIKILSVGVGKSVDMEELRAMASPPVARNVFTVANFSQMAAVRAQFQQQSCAFISDFLQPFTPSGNSSQCASLQNKLKTVQASFLQVARSPFYSKASWQKMCSRPPKMPDLSDCGGKEGEYVKKVYGRLIDTVQQLCHLREPEEGCNLPAASKCLMNLVNTFTLPAQSPCSLYSSVEVCVKLNTVRCPRAVAWPLTQHLGRWKQVAESTCCQGHCDPTQAVLCYLDVHHKAKSPVPDWKGICSSLNTSKACAKNQTMGCDPCQKDTIRTIGGKITAQLAQTCLAPPETKCRALAALDCKTTLIKFKADWDGKAGGLLCLKVFEARKCIAELTVECDKATQLSISVELEAIVATYGAQSCDKDKILPVCYQTLVDRVKTILDFDPLDRSHPAYKYKPENQQGAGSTKGPDSKGGAQGNSKKPDSAPGGPKVNDKKPGDNKSKGGKSDNKGPGGKSDNKGGTSDKGGKSVNKGGKSQNSKDASGGSKKSPQESGHKVDFPDTYLGKVCKEAQTAFLCTHESLQKAPPSAVHGLSDVLTTTWKLAWLKCQDILEPLSCFTCNNATNNEACNKVPPLQCKSENQMCQTVVRTSGDTVVVSMEKKCVVPYECRPGCKGDKCYYCCNTKGCNEPDDGPITGACDVQKVTGCLSQMSAAMLKTDKVNCSLVQKQTACIDYTRLQCENNGRKKVAQTLSGFLVSSTVAKCRVEQSDSRCGLFAVSALASLAVSSLGTDSFDFCPLLTSVEMGLAAAQRVGSKCRDEEVSAIKSSLSLLRSQTWSLACSPTIRPLDRCDPIAAYHRCLPASASDCAILSEREECMKNHTKGCQPMQRIFPYQALCTKARRLCPAKPVEVPELPEDLRPFNKCLHAFSSSFDAGKVDPSVLLAPVEQLVTCLITTWEVDSIVAQPPVYKVYITQVFFFLQRVLLPAVTPDEGDVPVNNVTSQCATGLKMASFSFYEQVILMLLRPFASFSTSADFCLVSRELEVRIHTQLSSCTVEEKKYQQRLFIRLQHHRASVCPDSTPLPQCSVQAASKCLRQFTAVMDFTVDQDGVDVCSALNSSLACVKSYTLQCENHKTRIIHQAVYETVSVYRSTCPQVVSQEICSVGNTTDIEPACQTNSSALDACDKIPVSVTCRSVKEVALCYKEAVGKCTSNADSLRVRFQSAFPVQYQFGVKVCGLNVSTWSVEGGQCGAPVCDQGAAAACLTISDLTSAAKAYAEAPKRMAQAAACLEASLSGCDVTVRAQVIYRARANLTILVNYFPTLIRLNLTLQVRFSDPFRDWVPVLVRFSEMLDQSILTTEWDLLPLCWWLHDFYSFLKEKIGDDQFKTALLKRATLGINATLAGVCNDPGKIGVILNLTPINVEASTCPVREFLHEAGRSFYEGVVTGLLQPASRSHLCRKLREAQALNLSTCSAGRQRQMDLVVTFFKDVSGQVCGKPHYCNVRRVHKCVLAVVNTIGGLGVKSSADDVCRSVSVLDACISRFSYRCDDLAMSHLTASMSSVRHMAVLACGKMVPTDPAPTCARPEGEACDMRTVRACSFRQISSLLAFFGNSKDARCRSLELTESCYDRVNKSCMAGKSVFKSLYQLSPKALAYLRDKWDCGDNSSEPAVCSERCDYKQAKECINTLSTTLLFWKSEENACSVVTRARQCLQEKTGECTESGRGFYQKLLAAKLKMYATLTSHCSDVYTCLRTMITVSRQILSKEDAPEPKPDSKQGGSDGNSKGNKSGNNSKGGGQSGGKKNSAPSKGADNPGSPSTGQETRDSNSSLSFLCLRAHHSWKCASSSLQLLPSTQQKLLLPIFQSLWTVVSQRCRDSMPLTCYKCSNVSVTDFGSGTSDPCKAETELCGHNERCSSQYSSVQGNKYVTRGCMKFAHCHAKDKHNVDVKCCDKDRCNTNDHVPSPGTGETTSKCYLEHAVGCAITFAELLLSRGSVDCKTSLTKLVCVSKYSEYCPEARTLYTAASRLMMTLARTVCVHGPLSPGCSSIAVSSMEAILSNAFSQNFACSGLNASMASLDYQEKSGKCTALDLVALREVLSYASVISSGVCQPDQCPKPQTPPPVPTPQTTPPPPPPKPQTPEEKRKDCNYMKTSLCGRKAWRILKTWTQANKNKTCSDVRKHAMCTVTTLEGCPTPPCLQGLINKVKKEAEGQCSMDFSPPKDTKTDPGKEECTQSTVCDIEAAMKCTDSVTATALNDSSLCMKLERAVKCQFVRTRSCRSILSTVATVHFQTTLKAAITACKPSVLVALPDPADVYTSHAQCFRKLFEQVHTAMNSTSFVKPFCLASAAFRACQSAQSSQKLSSFLANNTLEMLNQVATPENCANVSKNDSATRTKRDSTCSTEDRTNATFFVLLASMFNFYPLSSRAKLCVRLKAAQATLSLQLTDKCAHLGMGPGETQVLSDLVAYGTQQQQKFCLPEEYEPSGCRPDMFVKCMRDFSIMASMANTHPDTLCRGAAWGLKCVKKFSVNCSGPVLMLVQQLWREMRAMVGTSCPSLTLGLFCPSTYPSLTNPLTCSPDKAKACLPKATELGSNLVFKPDYCSNIKSKLACAKTHAEGCLSSEIKAVQDAANATKGLRTEVSYCVKRNKTAGLSVSLLNYTTACTAGKPCSLKDALACLELKEGESPADCQVLGRMRSCLDASLKSCPPAVQVRYVTSWLFSASFQTRNLSCTAPFKDLTPSHSQNESDSCMERFLPNFVSVMKNKHPEDNLCQVFQDYQSCVNGETRVATRLASVLKPTYEILEISGRFCQLWPGVNTSAAEASSDCDVEGASYCLLREMVWVHSRRLLPNSDNRHFCYQWQSQKIRSCVTKAMSKCSGPVKKLFTALVDRTNSLVQESHVCGSQRVCYMREAYHHINKFSVSVSNYTVDKDSKALCLKKQKTEISVASFTAKCYTSSKIGISASLTRVTRLVEGVCKDVVLPPPPICPSLPSDQRRCNIGAAFTCVISFNKHLLSQGIPGPFWRDVCSSLESTMQCAALNTSGCSREDKNLATVVSELEDFRKMASHHCHWLTADLCSRTAHCPVQEAGCEAGLQVNLLKDPLADICLYVRKAYACVNASTLTCTAAQRNVAIAHITRQFQRLSVRELRCFGTELEPCLLKGKAASWEALNKPANANDSAACKQMTEARLCLNTRLNNMLGGDRTVQRQTVHSIALKLITTVDRWCSSPEAQMCGPPLAQVVNALYVFTISLASNTFKEGALCTTGQAFLTQIADLRKLYETCRFAGLETVEKEFILGIFHQCKSDKQADCQKATQAAQKCLTSVNASSVQCSEVNALSRCIAPALGLCGSNVSQALTQQFLSLQAKAGACVRLPLIALSTPSTSPLYLSENGGSAVIKFHFTEAFAAYAASSQRQVHIRAHVSNQNPPICLEDSSRQISQVSVLYDGNSPCGVRMGSGGLQNWSAEHTIRLVASVDGRQDKAQQANVSIYADVYHWEGTANTTGKWVKDHTSKLATYEVHIEDTDTGAVCSSVGTHTETFDKIMFNNFEAGEFVFYRSTAMDVQVLVSYQQCTSAATCTCSVKVATKGANVTFERCRQVGEPGPPEDIHITRSGNGTAQGMQVYRHQNLKSYFVVLPTGTIVTIKESLYYLDVWVSASTLDFGKTEGLCGLFDQNAYNDFILPSGEVYTLQENEMQHGMLSPRGYIRQWRPSPRQYRQGSAVTRSCGCLDASPYSDQCTAFTRVATCDFVQGEQITQLLATADNSAPSTKTRRRRAASGIDFATNFTQNRGWPTASNWTKDKAWEYCENLLEQSQPLKFCARAILLANGSYPYERFIAACVDDIRLSDSTVNGNFTVTQAMESCRSLFLHNTTYQTNPKVRFHVLQFFQHMCENNCNGNGDCKMGVCHCYPGFVGGNCSYQRTSLPRPANTKVIKNGLCEVSSTSRCEDIFITGQGFVESSYLSCHVQSVKVVSSEFNSPQGLPTKVSATLVTATMAHCKMARSDHAQQTALVAISNDGFNPTPSMLYTAYDPRCYACHPYTHKCSHIATSTCEVKGRCYMPAEASPTDHCLFCEPRKSATKWSVKDLPECEDRRDSSSDDDDTEQVSPLMVAILAVGAGLLIVAVIGVAVCFLKKRRGRPSGSDQDMGCPPPSYDNHGYASSSQMEPQQFFNHGSIHKRAVTHESAYIPSTVQTD